MTGSGVRGRGSHADTGLETPEPWSLASHMGIAPYPHEEQPDEDEPPADESLADRSPAPDPADA
jgi:hypothetical protein